MGLCWQIVDVCILLSLYFLPLALNKNLYFSLSCFPEATLHLHDHRLQILTASKFPAVQEQFRFIDVQGRDVEMADAELSSEAAAEIRSDSEAVVEPSPPGPSRAAARLGGPANLARALEVGNDSLMCLTIVDKEHH